MVNGVKKMLRTSWSEGVGWTSEGRELIVRSIVRSFSVQRSKFVSRRLVM